MGEIMAYIESMVNESLDSRMKMFIITAVRILVTLHMQANIIFCYIFLLYFIVK